VAVSVLPANLGDWYDKVLQELVMRFDARTFRDPLAPEMASKLQNAMYRLNLSPPHAVHLLARGGGASSGPFGAGYYLGSNDDPVLRVTHEQACEARPRTHPAGRPASVQQELGGYHDGISPSMATRTSFMTTWT